MSKKSNVTIGLTGNPNTGKSTLFNALTGARQHVGNWPGKTVEKKEGEFTYQKNNIKVVDLPGSYSLTAYTEEEIITSEFILEEKPDVVVQIVDAQNLERNLFLTLQLIELGAPLVLAVNMVDLAKKDGISIDFKQLSKLLNAPVIPIGAKKKEGLDHLMKVILRQAKSPQVSKVKLKYGTEVDDELNKIKEWLLESDPKIIKTELDWSALKLLEGDLRIEQKMTQKPYYSELKLLVEKSLAHLEGVFSRNIHTILARTRYGFIKGLSQEITASCKSSRTNISDRMDCLLTNKFLGIPTFLLVVWLMFQATFKLSGPLMGWIEGFFGMIGDKVITLLGNLGASEWFISLIVDGIIGGVGGVLVFIPIIGILFLLMAILEDSGYMARVAYVMDKLMHRIGLHGKASIPLILGFGCNVPGIMATRTLETKQDRLLAILINPFMSCGARLPVYALFTGAFFSAYQGWIIFSLYLLGILVAIVAGLVFKKLFSKKLSSPFVIELPPYRWPALRGVFIHAFEKVWIFIKKAGTIILAFSVVIWLLASLPAGVEYGAQESYAGQIGETIAPVFEPLGFGNWESGVALMFGFVAKEVVVSTYGTLYGIGDIESGEGTLSLSEALQNDFTPLSAYALMVFVLLYVPCMAALAVIKRETNSWKWPLFTAVYMTGIAWLMAFIVYQGGLLLGFN
ncbi:ferrous iron transport protein B [Candidatus Peregrinibacteria bacterium]|jgi:ferrous iron transport protein B|nr:ferrous iron transport protein B [Candidatus Peregrinibacteria bacterium]MBT7484577.1 ferrous iron transport protein B [Candidatus Peregrinibacteria bacterium]MBT7702844.1 ferrous iron transport protein B [Candidatus Peregrinibacteria bacterium]